MEEKRGGLELSFIRGYLDKWGTQGIDDLDVRREMAEDLANGYDEDSIKGVTVFYRNLFPSATDFALAMDAFGKRFKYSGSVVVNYAKPTNKPRKDICWVTFEIFKKKPKWLYRLESNDPNNGLWYDSNGEFCFGIGSVGNCTTASLPMDYDERYRLGGRMWHSSCSNKEDLLHWYSFENAVELLSKGFSFRKYLATEYREYALETTFIKSSCIGVEDVDIYKLFGVGR
jgi:hypothetical protein